jgi:hypothetical protein
MSQSFSDRYGFKPAEPEITVREDAPDDLRYAVAQIAINVGLTPSQIRDVVCSVLFVAPDRNNWSQYPNIWDEVRRLLEDCAWFKVYDIAERLHRGLHYQQADQFRDELNRLFREKGIGWELKDQDGIVFRGSAPFAAATTNAVEILTETGRPNAASEIREALRDISRRPNPDRTGAIQHSIAALECVAREIANEPGLTLGRLLPRLGLPRPLDEAVEKLWGFASDRARHIREGQQLGDDEAELVVSVACAVSIFLIHRTQQVR